MSEPVTITDKFGDSITVEVSSAGVIVVIEEHDEAASVALSTDQCAALIAAITDAAKVVTGEGK